MGSLADHLITVESKTFGASVEVIVEGEIDIATIGRVADPISRALEMQRPRLVLDLERVGFLETTCIRLLEQTAESAETAGIDFIVIPPQGKARELLDIAGVKYVAGQRNRLGGSERSRKVLASKPTVDSLERVIKERRRLGHRS